ncbi:uncharacterized protein ATNIH1004_002252 [Aspergillus tanneri]|uniref:NAD(P)-binding domain-containing protein n=1 Tax=Aspergillus tanneri TaxID=1220188 RepID=A0A5M9MR36_9EURO|nr:uncharacterized protein ATNIH1004_002252 [Aspergillus tanneri]KAA8649581.1 hypothetical protein ATNIH1004_002252 [Aspergillus tanneri]
MKIILTGSTGFIGGEVLSQCLASESIRSIVVLSRRDLPPAIANHTKIEVVIMNDFLNYQDSVINQLQGAQACIWSLGKARMPDNDAVRKVSIDYTMAAIKVISQLQNNKDDSIFRFIYLSGGLVERDPLKPLWFNQDYRRIRGEAENALLKHAEKSQRAFESYIMRPGMVLTKQRTIGDFIRGLAPSVKVDVLAKAMVEIALHGNQSRIFENSTISEIYG